MATDRQKARARSKASKAAAETRARRNPLTGQEPNTYTATEGRELAAPTNVREFHGDGRERSRLQGLHREATKPGGVVDAQIGYGKPEGMTDRHFAWVTGAHRMFPNTAAERGTPAINEPHPATNGVTVQRRAEDLSGKEYRKGLDVLAHYGHDSKDPMRSLRDTHQRTLNRVIAEHAQAGVEESASQMFYGGRTTTEIPHAPEMEAHHDRNVMAAHQRFRDAVHTTALSPDFQMRTPHLAHRERMSAATAIVSQAVADTSPNAKWRDGDKWPNIEQAEESVRAGVTGTEARFVTGRIQNVHKAASRVGDMVHHDEYDTHNYGDPKGAAKTVAFRGALTEKDSADAFKVSDVHEASVIAPGLPTAKGKVYTDHEGTRHTIHPDQPASASKGMQPVLEPLGAARAGKFKQKVGLSRPEEMLAKGASLVHTLNDRASREVLANSGLSRGVDYADNLHAMQGAAWGSQQMIRPDVNVSHADQYPVVRDWGHEGINVPNSDDVLGSLGRGDVHTVTAPAYRENPNKTGMSKSPETAHLVNPTKSKPYPVMPGE